MKTVSTLLFAFLLTLTAETETEAITTTLNYYMEGGMNKDFETLEKAFHKDAIMTIADEKAGSLKQVNAREFFSGMKGEPLKRINTVKSIDIAGNTAVARLHIEDDEKIFHDFMTLQKLDGRWWIVNKSFYREGK